MPRAPRDASSRAAKLGRYRGKRTPGITNEPFGGEIDPLPAPADPSTEGAFVVHLHDATRRHYDLRLEAGGVLLSFAVPRGPSLDPADKALAVKTEDHPVEYLDFEDVIPAGEYGGGAMIVWDRGAVRYLEGPPDVEVAAGKIHVELRGMKLRGRWALVKLAKSAKQKDEWLLFKKNDEHANAARSIVDEQPRSVMSGLTVDELEDRDAIGRAHVERALAAGAARGGVRDLLDPSACPLVAPAEDGVAPAGVALYDAVLEGIRVLATRDGDVVTLQRWTAGGAERIEAFYPEIVRALRALPGSRVVLDGELVAFDEGGRPSRTLLAERAARIARDDTHRAVTTTPVVLVATDLLAIGEADARPLPIERRRALLAGLLPPVGFLRAASPLEGEESRVVATCASLGVASLIRKARGSAYAADAAWTLVSTGIARGSRSVVDHRGGDARRALRHVPVTNREKRFWPADGYTKGDLVDYYAGVADVVLPYLAGRPVILVRYPDGIDGKSFYQWNVPAGMPAWVRTLSIDDPDPATRRDEGPKRGFLVDDAPTLVYIANLGCIPLHVLASRARDLSEADFFTIDFDVKQSELGHAITLARTLRGLLDEIGLRGFPKTSGQTGLHVLVPLGPGQSFRTARALADLLGRLLVDRHPDLATMERIVSRRGPRVYVDTGQTGTTRAIVAPYSVRAVPGARVSAPLTWAEVEPGLDPGAFTIRTLPARIARKGDLLAGLLDERPDVPAAVARLGEIVQGRARGAAT